MKDILDYWPFPFEPRKNQIVALKWLQEQPDHIRYLLLESPVGSGKSAIGVTYSLFLEDQLPGERKNSFILTPQRMLQSQYETSMSGIDEINMASLYGRSNYDCNEYNVTCDIGAHMGKKCENCPCDGARQYAQTSNEAVMNYALALNSFSFTKGFGPRRLLIMDECHTLEEHLVSFGTVAISKNRCEKYDMPFEITDDLEAAYNWTKEVYLPKLTDVILELTREYNRIRNKKGRLTSKEKKFMSSYMTLMKHQKAVDRTVGMDFEYFAQEFVYTKEKYMFEFKRIYGRAPFAGILDPMADKFLFMSSTILNKDGFCSDLGLEPNETAFLSLDSEFKINNRKVIYYPQMKMNAKWSRPENEEGRGEMLSTIQAICGANEGNSGLIHTANFQIAKWLVENLNVKHKIFHHNPGCKKDRNTVINQFMEHHGPGLLISPSSTEGLDLKDDLGRFAIFCKVPFGFLGDEWIRTRMNLSDEWYKRMALIDVIQGGGRVVRTETDYGTVFILDESWDFLFRTTNRMIPKWWKAAYMDKSR